MKRFFWIAALLASSASFAQRGGAANQLATYIPTCVATSGTCPSNGYVCASGSTLYRCTISGGWGTLGDGQGTGFASDPSACSANQWATDIGQTGTLTCSQPAFSNLSGSATDAQIPDTITIDNATTAAKVTNGASPTVNAAGHVAVDTTEDELLYYGAAVRALSYKQSISFTLETPTDADNFLIWKLPYDITVTAINCIVDPADSSESVVIDVQERNTSGDSPATLDATITCSNTGAADDGSLSNPGLTTGEWMSIDIGTVTGTVTQVAVTITYTVDRK